jgi:uncharacterized integral membrane protein
MNIPKSAAKPPGRKLLKRLSLKTQWTLLAIGGLLLTLYGLSILTNANSLRHAGVESYQWLLLGLYSFAILTAGFLILGQAFRLRVLIDSRRQIRKEINRLKKNIESKKIKERDTLRKHRRKTKNPTK